MCTVNFVLAVFTLLFSLIQKGQGVHGLPDYFCFIIFIIIAILAILSTVRDDLVWPLVGATITILFLLLIALINHLFFCYRNRVNIFEVAGSALIYLLLISISIFFTFTAIRWRVFVNRRRKAKENALSKESKALLKQEQ